jgi:hypothetical protein
MRPLVIVETARMKETDKRYAKKQEASPTDRFTYGTRVPA